MRCPQCNSAETLDIGLISLRGDGIAAIPEAHRKKVFPTYTRVKAKACVSCGHIFDLSLEKPEKLAPFAGYNGSN